MGMTGRGEGGADDGAEASSPTSNASPDGGNSRVRGHKQPILGSVSTAADEGASIGAAVPLFLDAAPHAW